MIISLTYITARCSCSCAHNLKECPFCKALPCSLPAALPFIFQFYLPQKEEWAKLGAFNPVIIVPHLCYPSILSSIPSLSLSLSPLSLLSPLLSLLFSLLSYLSPISSLSPLSPSNFIQITRNYMDIRTFTDFWELLECSLYSTSLIDVFEQINTPILEWHF
jgi:hypothetical protein